jgi:23S rRNA pseudouridine1911/1915/1917 synthase
MAENYTADEESGAVPRALAGLRMDLALVKMFPQYSRSRLQAWLESGHVLVDGKPSERNAKTAGGETIVLRRPAAAGTGQAVAQALPLEVVFEDDDLIVVDKPAGLVVHPGAGNPDRTLMNALLAHAPSLREVPRAGIVHRLDKDTTGLLVVAKNLTAQVRLAAQLAERSVKRTYLALVYGVPPAHGAVDAPIGRDTRSRTRMAVTQRGRQSRTSYRVLERFGAGARSGFALLECRLDTGRTHQIRVHLQHIGHPLLGDPVYRRGASKDVDFARQALHAAELELVHPRTGLKKAWKAPLPADMKKLLAQLRRAG